MQNPYQQQIDALSEQIAETRQLLDDPEMGALAQVELENLESQRSALQQAAEQLESGMDQATGTSSGERVHCTIEIRPGAGGDEAKIWAHDLLRMYIRFAEQQNLKIEFIDDLVVKVKGRTSLSTDSRESVQYTAWELLENESGVHRVQRVPETEAQGRIHTSTASVAVLPEIPASEISVREEDLEWSFMRAGGAGGQSVNKTNSAVRLVHTPSGIVVNARQERKQAQNRQIALELLRAQLWEIEEEKRAVELGQARSKIGRARRAEKIRTYNYPQNRITDHRTKDSWHNLPVMLDGSIADMVLDVRAHLAEAENSEAEGDQPTA